MKKLYRILLLTFTILTILFLPYTPVQAKEPAVHALFFYSQTCPHCHKVVTEDLPPLLEKYPEQLFILGIDTSMAEGYALYEAAIRNFQIPTERMGVPTLIVGETVLVGSLEIPEQFPGIVESGMADGGISWPAFPELQKLLESEGILGADVADEGGEPADSVQIEQADANVEHVIEEDAYPEKETLGISTDLEETVLASAQLTLRERFAQDLAGNAVSVVVLIGMVLSVTGVGIRVFRLSVTLKPWPIWVVPALVIIGTVVAVYMGFVEVTNTEAVCGPVGDCNTVQQSSYASLFGIIPIGLFGVAGYLVVGLTWLIAKFGPERWRKISTLGIWILSLFGAFFSIYLTFLEPFVIGATCAWCLTSAIVMNLLLWASTAPAIKVWNEYRLT